MAYWDFLTKDDYQEAINIELRQEDIDELAASTGATDTVEVLKQSIASSEITCVIKDDDHKIIGVFGVGASPVDGMGFPWLLGSDGLVKISRQFARESRWFIEELRVHYPMLVNWVSAENTASLRWLKWLGFTIETAPNYLCDPDVPFYQFYMYGKEFDNV